MAYVQSLGPVGRRPAAPGATWSRRTHESQLDRPARRLGHRLRGPGRGAEDHRAARCTSAPGSRRVPTSLGKVLLAGLSRTSWRRCWPSRAGPGWRRAGGRSGRARRGAARGAGPGLGAHRRAARAGIRSVAAPLRDGAGRVVAAMNVTVHAAETSVRDADRRLPAAAAARPPAGSAPTSRCATRCRHTVAARRPDRVRPLDTAQARIADSDLDGQTSAIRTRGDWMSQDTGDARPGPARGAPGRRLLPDPRRAVREHAAGRHGRRGHQGGEPRRRRHPHLGAAGPRRRRRPTTWRSTATSARSRSTSRTPPTWPWPASWPARADVVIENFKPGGLAKFGLDYDSVAAQQPGRRLRLDQRLRLRRRRQRCPATT